jgi:xanthine dehydrogenase accessory factor
MREVIKALQASVAQGRPAALATVVSTWGSAPRPPGSKMLVAEDGSMVGSVSAGCVEGAVVMREQRPRLLTYGVADDTAWQVGLACGGEIRVFVEPVSSLEASAAEGEPRLLDVIGRAIEEDRTVVRAVVVSGPAPTLGRSLVTDSQGRAASTLQEDLMTALSSAAEPLLTGGLSQSRSFPAAQGEAEVFFDVISPPPSLVIVGAVHIGESLCRQAKLLGYRVIVVDPRRGFNTEARFAEADERRIAWPQEAFKDIGLTSGTAVAVLSHDPKIDDRGVMAALRSPAFYVGALGSSRTTRLRQERLLAEGMGKDELARLHAPIGLDLKGRAPEEIALSILAEIVAVRSGSALAP